MNVLKVLRLFINLIDIVIILMLSFRNQVVKGILWYKNKKGLIARDQARETVHIKWSRKVARRLKLPEGIAVKIIQQIMDSFTSLQLSSRNTGHSGIMRMYCPDCGFNTDTFPSAEHNGERLCNGCKAPLSEPAKQQPLLK